ncbi:S-adenosylmethionine:tRNA ribosyltransferase-isomerase [Parafilimonas terrae]|uniref:S-adenosylmethionine:tRNA ribosyltransferase-isomerase n=1 Tax=Parafilimonas terrae TaxID=1465490 RepID=A0A1I5Z9V2_9BACT|nr:S-adenosylmethionine:tRNA ribosyltransferase-isomerase [Parafilimonas terrae]SFQ53250.1 S-adenosylmethionine:tRNA ribosyltransferase-isomerase [Parafilimonas terrae]
MSISPKQLQIKDFDYDLPDEKIAKHPLAKRDASKLLIYKNGEIKTDNFIHLSNYLPEGSLIIFNNTKVVEARLLFKKTTGTTIEIFCLEPADDYADITTAMLQHKKVLWKCLIGNAKKWKDEILVKKILHNGKEIELSVKKISRQGENFIIEFSWNDEQLSFAEILHTGGVIPLPPYMHRDADDEDKKRYQTVYAKHDGSVAAPTAGLHFTGNVFERLSAKNIQRDFVTLHVGAGTFKPVKTETIEAHEMHSEFFEVSVELIEKLINASNQNIIAVGTTSLRTLESLYWMGVKISQQSTVNGQQNITIDDITIHQWDVYELNDENISFEDALHALLEWMKANNLNKLIAKTQIIIAPPYKLKVADILITNFHQPKSTLLLLVAAVIGNDWKKVYDYALNNNFRFLSYGDSCLFFAL